MSLDFFLSLLSRPFSLWRDIFCSTKPPEKTNRQIMCEEYSFPWKRKIVHSPGPQAEFDDCLIAANFAGNMPVTVLIGRISM